MTSDHKLYFRPQWQKATNSGQSLRDIFVFRLLFCWNAFYYLIEEVAHSKDWLSLSNKINWYQQTLLEICVCRTCGRTRSSKVHHKLLWCDHHAVWWNRKLRRTVNSFANAPLQSWISQSTQSHFLSVLLSRQLLCKWEKVLRCQQSGRPHSRGSPSRGRPSRWPDETETKLALPPWAPTVSDFYQLCYNVVWFHWY